MSATDRQQAKRSPVGRPLAVIGVGLLLTLLGVAAAFVTHDNGEIAGQLRQAYPDWSAGKVDDNATVVFAYLAGVAALGALCWLVTGIAVARRARWARWTATALFAVATTVALLNFAQAQPVVDYLAMLAPCVAGGTAVALLWLPSIRGQMKDIAIA